jgi:hypothetical protein
VRFEGGPRDGQIEQVERLPEIWWHHEMLEDEGVAPHGEFPLPGATCSYEIHWYELRGSAGAWRYVHESIVREEKPK